VYWNNDKLAIDYIPFLFFFTPFVSFLAFAGLLVCEALLPEPIGNHGLPPFPLCVFVD
jgi:hypothetical protein